MKIHLRYFLLIATLGWFNWGHATNYYVAKDGSDSQPGTEAEPFLTIAKAGSVLQPGDTCFIKAGVYREVVTVQNHGTASQPIVITNYQDDSVLISATEPLTGWTNHQGDIYRASYDMNRGTHNMVYVNGKPMDWARWPNNTDNEPYTVEAVSVQGGSASTIQSSEITSSLDWSGGYVWYLAAHSGTSWTRRINNSQSGEVSFPAVDINRWPFNPHNPTIVRNNNRGQFFLFGIYEALDYPEEWYYDEAKDSVYLQAPGNADPNTLVVEVAARERTMLIEKNYVHIDGINAFGGKVELKGNHDVLRNGTFTQCLTRLDALDNSSAQVSEGAVHVRASDIIVEYNVIDGSSLSGVFVQGWNNVTRPIIRHNLIKNINTVGIHASPIRSAATNNLIWSNTIHTTARDGIYVAGVNNEIAYNDVYDCMKMNNDGGLYYTVGNDDSRNTEIHHNWFHDSDGPEYADGRAAGIYLDNDSKGYTVHHNVVWNISWSGVQMNWDIWDNDIYHNTLWNVSRAMGTWLRQEHTMERIRVYNNLSNEADWIGNDLQNNILLANSPFKNYEAQNFIPQANTSLIDAGLVIPGINDGYAGTAPDVGAYESGFTPWRPGVNSITVDDVTTSIDDLPAPEQRVRVFPNPLAENQDLQVLLPSTQLSAEVSVFDLNGRQILQETVSGQEFSLDRGIFETAGLYFLQVNASDLQWSSKLLVP